VASVHIIKDGTTLVGRNRSGHAPAVTVDGVPMTRGATTTIRWHASDKDGDMLAAAIDYSSDGGHLFRRVWSGTSVGFARMPARYLSRSSNARVRVTVNDGFQAAVAISRRFRAPGARPLVSIVSPRPGVRQPNDAPLVLIGQAFDDRSRMLGGSRMRWMLGRRVLGTGASVTVSGLPAGTRRIGLVARDDSGRSAVTSVVVRLLAARPLFLTLLAPRSAAPRARSLHLTVASSVAATLLVRVAGLRAQRFAVGRRARRVAVGIRPGRAPLRLGVSLVAGGLTRTAVLSVTRR
jgi:hypothetical protein